jgi:hypothetical protein
LYFSGGLPANLHFGPTGLPSPINTGTSSSSIPQPPPPSSSSNSTSSNDPNNYAGVFAQMLNMMSNQNIVYLIKFIFVIKNFYSIEYTT